MADQDMRLRLVVRRHDLPELRLMWHIRLESNPTVSKLLEQLNAHVPLESDDWGLEDYVVELHDNDGTDFECLHYQLVRSVLKPDDRVFIRALERDDHRRRRIGGRDQISSDGRHLIDGVPFGRPHLRAPVGRPAIRIPPRKRARFTYPQENEDPDSPALFLTNGEPGGHEHAPARVRIADQPGDTESDDDDADFIDSDAESTSSSNVSDLGEDLGGDDEDENMDVDEDGDEDETGDETGEETGEESEGEVEEDLDQEIQDLVVENANLEGKDLSEEQAISLETLDKLSALGAAFPEAPINVCEKVLAAYQGSLDQAYAALCAGFRPKLTEEAFVASILGRNDGSIGRGQRQAPINPISSSKIAPGQSTTKRKLEEQWPLDEGEQEEEEADDDEGPNTALWKKYDHAGFPPGSITSGRGLVQMAEISASHNLSKANGASDTTSTTLKAATEDPVEEEDDDDATSSSGSSCSSSSSSNDDDDASEEDASSESSSSGSSSAGADDLGLGDSDDSSDSGTSDSVNDDDSDNDSDSGPEEYPSMSPNRGHSILPTKKPTQGSDSSDDSSDSSSESDDDEDGSLSINARTVATGAAAQPVQRPRIAPNSAQQSVTPSSVPPGAGKDSTKRRNARRRAAKQGKREATNAASAAGSSIEGQNAIKDERALFEAKRRALLDAIATGGIEIGPSGDSTLDQSVTEVDGAKRKRTEDHDDLSPENDRAAVRTSNSPLGDDENESPGQKRRRVDLSAGRRLVFGALGVRNPKTKEDEDKLRDKFRNDAQLSTKRQSKSQSQPPLNESPNVGNEEFDNDNWKLKINYRAVECCDDTIQLSPAPFPFQQRWDPQQQNRSASKKNKRGGQGKRAQRNDSHYYEGPSYEMTDGTFYDENTAMNGVDVVTLNYDDAESPDYDHTNDPVNNTSQVTDLDDLPSLPQDVSVLPVLHPGEAQVGMVITWQKWSCSSATCWQPLLSRVTAVVTVVDDDTTVLNVYLAKRDRHLDGNEKRYDDRTGQRIYDKFEAPDLIEEDVDADYDDTGIDEGYRTVPWAEMQDPRILQHPLETTVAVDPTSTRLHSDGISEVDTSVGNQTGAAIPPTSDQPGPAATDNGAMVTSPRLTDEENRTGEQHGSNTAPEMGLENGGMEPHGSVASNSISHQAGQNQQPTDSPVSDVSQISSPSRQLHETTSQAVESRSPSQNWAQIISLEHTDSPWPNTSSSGPLPATTSSQLRPEGASESELITGTPKVVLPQAVVSSVSSVYGGRQPDYAIDVDGPALDPFDATDEMDGQMDDDDVQDRQSTARSSLTPRPTPQASHQAVTPKRDGQTGGDSIFDTSPIAPRAGEMLSSPSSIWCTAVTSHSTQSPSRAQVSSSMPQLKMNSQARDEQYEEAMRTLDEEFDPMSDAPSSPPAMTSSLEVKRESSTQPPPRTLPLISPPPQRRPARRFTLPVGTQVVELSSDSESDYVENYADDDIDGTYTPERANLPRGNGWVKKRGQEKRRIR